uniref:EGF-like domain-containing protein n=1 Tax=Schistosoma mansoni TaxID=6183 RepID=A0A3Q0KST9_SCHMA
MCYRFVLLIVFHLHSLLCTKSVSELWIRFRQNPSFVKSFNFKSSDYFSSTDNENTLKKYSRGFPRGIWGTAAFPDIIRGLSDNDTGYSFWLKYDSIVFNESYRFKESFNNFRNQIYSDSCIDDNLNKWKCCEQPNHPSCFKLPTRTKVIESMLSDPQVDISSVFAYLWCTKVWANFHSFNAAQQKDFLEDIETGCPNPCFGNPCKSTQGVKNHICQVTGAFENEYKCHCKEEMIWDKNLRICLPINPCDRKRFQVCIPENTLQCIAYNTTDYECICKSEYMGIDCSLLRDACYERVDKSQPNGNVNCQIHLGNMCQPILGTDYYQCICLKSYQPLLYTTEPNCFGRINPCHTIHITDLLIDSNENQNIHPSTIIHWGLTCLNGGQCVVSEDFTHATCVCPTAPDGSLLYTGLNCEYSVGVWSSWTQPSPCYPEDCGLSRYRWRRRKCLNTTMVDNVIYHSSDSLANLNGIDTLKRTMPLPCPGASEEILPCPSLEPCFKSPSSGFMMNGIFSYETLYYFTYTTTFIF